MDTALPTPRRALGELDDRRQRMFARAEGRVLDLSDYSSFSLPALVAAHERYDTIVSVMQISVAPDAASFCRDVAELLAPDGRVLFLEPTAAVGVAGAVQHAFGPWVRRTTGRRLDYDIPALIRGAGLSIGDCERITVRALWPYRSFVEGIAHLPFTKSDT
jgi:SAM-dependent methyltransferase